MDVGQLRQSFLDYFKKLGYQLAPSAPVVSEDPSVLFTTAGMQQFKDFYLHPDLASARALVNVQPVIRTTDIAEVGDTTHLTLFEMLGNFRFGESSVVAMKERAINEAWGFLRQHLKVNPDRVEVTVFAGSSELPPDTDSEKIWKKLGVKVSRRSEEENFWSLKDNDSPCGPTTEIFVDQVEVWNLVFNQYHRDADANLVPLKQVGLDTGAGLERLSATIQGKSSIWEIEPFKGYLRYFSQDATSEARIIVDHMRAIIYMVSEGLTPSNKAESYILRRLIRKAVFLSRVAPPESWQELAEAIAADLSCYKLRRLEEIMAVFEAEKEQFEKNLAKAVNHLDRWLANNEGAGEKEMTELAFYMYESFGFPKELVLEYLVSQGWSVDREYFNRLFAAHQEKSRVGLDKQFKGGLADHQERTVKHHSATHMLLAALRQELGPDVVQKGSNVTSERLRLDFSFGRKLTEEEIQKIEKLVNQKIAEDLPITKEEMPIEKALSSGAQAEFGHKYGPVVTVYSIGPRPEEATEPFSKELCGGPHVKRTGELGVFKILKEQASSGGVRRIKAKLV